jgi:hypothetical protein
VINISISEMEDYLGIRNRDKIECPYIDENGDCTLNRDCTDCEELYEQWLMNQIQRE